MADLTPEVIDALVRLMNDETDMGGLPDETILGNMKIGRAGRKLVGEGAAELHRRGWTWPQIAEHFPPVNQSTVHRWAQPYLREGES